MKKYQFLLFDADGTLFDYDQAEAEALQRTFEQFGLPWSEADLGLYRQINASVWKMLEQGQITPAALSQARFERLLQRLAHPEIVVEHFSTVYLANLGNCAPLIDGAIEVLAALSPQFQIAILTNGLKEVQRSRLKHAAIHPYLDEGSIIISEEVGFAKPSPAFFDVAFERLGSPPRDAALMIGDSLSSDIQGATQYGLDSCWFNPSGLPRPDGLAITYEIRHLKELLPLLLGTQRP